MKILIDECVPHLVKRGLPNRVVKTVREMGWSGTQNGELLVLAEASFEVFVTSDKNLRYQQNLRGRKLAIILLPSNQVPVVRALLSKLDSTIDKVAESDFIVL